MRHTQHFIAILGILSACFFTPAIAHQPFYVYLNNGGIEAFMTYDVDSITYSHLDLDSVWHNEYQVQEIWTPDSTYRYALTDIDSVSFITPETKYQPGVIRIDEGLMDYVISSDSLTILLQSTTPPDILPKVGDKLVTLEMNDKFPAGFAGIVTSVANNSNQIIVECTQADLTEIFETLYQVSSIYGYRDNGELKLSPKRLKPIDYDGKLDIKYPTISASLPIDIEEKIDDNKNFVPKFGTALSVSLTPELHIKSFLLISKNEGYYFNYSIVIDIDLEENISFFGAVSPIEISKPFKKDSKLLSVPIAFCTKYNFNPGWYLKLDGNIATSAVFQQKFRFASGGDFSTKGKSILKPQLSAKLVSHSSTVQGSMEATLGLGVYANNGLSFIHANLDEIALRVSAGIELNGKVILTDTEIENAQHDTQIYEKLKNSPLNFNFTVDGSLNCKAGKKVIYTFNPGLKVTVPIKSWALVPNFSDLTFKSLSNTSAQGTMQATGKCLFPIQIGMAVTDYGNEVAHYFKPELFDSKPITLDHRFYNINTKDPLKLHPKIKWFGFELLASPSAELEHKTWTNIDIFTITDSSYSKTQDFEYKGEKYFYRYNCRTTVALLDTTNVADWGYVYFDPKGDTAYISLTNFNTRRYTDDRYAYYRNNAEDSVVLAGYVHFRGDKEPTIEKKHTFLLSYNHYCSDNNHPHMIDLGLPSGTMWACHNLGASKPEDYGDYYAFAETTTKNTFYESNYLYFYNDYQFDGQYSYYENIGANLTNFGVTIGGKRGYDAVTASAEWDDGWRMPTKEEMQELIDSCQWTWTSKAGIIGYQVTGPNGNSIFLPASGGKVSGTNYSGDPDKLTFYRTDEWSGKQMGNKGFGYTYGLRFNQSDYSLSDACGKAWGYVIRPVMTKTEE